MNLDTARDELKELLGSRNDITDARYNLWLNFAYKEIAYAFPFFQNAKKQSGAMVVGAGTYNLPSDCLAIYSIRDSTLKRKISRTSFRKFDNIDSAQSGDPTHYIRYGNTIELTPVPSHANTLVLRYGIEVTDLSADIDEPILPDPWHEAWLMGAEVRGWRALRQMDQAALVKNEYIQLIRSRSPEWEQEEEDEEWGIEVRG